MTTVTKPQTVEITAVNGHIFEGAIITDCTYAEGYQPPTFRVSWKKTGTGIMSVTANGKSQVYNVKGWRNDMTAHPGSEYHYFQTQEWVYQIEEFITKTYAMFLDGSVTGSVEPGITSPAYSGLVLGRAWYCDGDDPNGPIFLKTKRSGKFFGEQIIGSQNQYILAIKRWLAKQTQQPCEEVAYNPYKGMGSAELFALAASAKGDLYTD